MPEPAGHTPELAATALRVVNHISAKVSYWDRDLKCVFANDAYHEWYGRSAAAMTGISLRELQGPAYEQNLPYVGAALAGQRQVFERQIQLPDGRIRTGIVTYTPDIVDGTVRGFSVHVADVTSLLEREAALAQTIREVIQILEKTKGSFRSKELGILRQRLSEVLSPAK